MLAEDQIEVPEPDLTPDELVARARAMYDDVRAEAQDTEAGGGYSAERHRRFVEAGFFRVVQPRRLGGYQFSVETFLRVIMEIARADMGTAWNLCLGTAHTLQVCAYFSERAQLELFAPDGHFSAPHRAAPVGTATQVDGGYVVRGRWEYSSGVTHATHVITSAMSPDPAGGPDRVLAPIIPIEAVRVLDDWGGQQTLGLRGSGSNTVLVEDVFVPEHHVCVYDWPYAEIPPEGTVGYRMHRDPQYLGRTLSIYYGEIAALVVGAARSSLEEYERLLLERTTALPPIVPRTESPRHLRSLGEARARVEAAEMLVLGAAREYRERGERWERDSEPFTVAHDDRIRCLFIEAVKVGGSVIEDLFKLGGSREIRLGSVLQRNFRDWSTASTHPFFSFDLIAEMSARLHLGLPVEIVF
jgi:3-hydroxy-9,10-secoandrosta-1,3,5(10)-triene-9,17-dione monooxygenase